MPSLVPSCSYIQVHGVFSNEVCFYFDYFPHLLFSPVVHSCFSKVSWNKRKSCLFALSLIFWDSQVSNASLGIILFKIFYIQNYFQVCLYLHVLCVRVPRLCVPIILHQHFCDQIMMITSPTGWYPPIIHHLIFWGMVSHRIWK